MKSKAYKTGADHKYVCQHKGLLAQPNCIDYKPHIHPQEGPHTGRERGGQN